MRPLYTEALRFARMTAWVESEKSKDVKIDQRVVNVHVTPSERTKVSFNDNKGCGCLPPTEDVCVRVY